MATAKKTKRTDYQRLQHKKKELCGGKATKTEVKAAASTYVKNSVAKAVKAAPKAKKTAVAKTAKVEAEKKANRILRSGCAMSAVVTGRKKTAKRAKKRVSGIDQASPSIGRRKAKRTKK